MFHSDSLELFQQYGCRHFAGIFPVIGESMVNKALTPDPIWPSPRLIRAGRTLAGVDQAALALKAGVTRQAVSVVEKDKGQKMDPRRRKILEAMQRALENDFGIEFFEASENSGEGVRFRKK